MNPVPPPRDSVLSQDRLLTRAARVQSHDREGVVSATGETEQQPARPELDAETATRHRVLIAAAVAAVLGDARIREIKAVSWTRRKQAQVRSAPDFRRQILSIPLDPQIDEEDGDGEEVL